MGGRRRETQERTERFSELCHQEYQRVLRTAFLMTGNREEARDLAQEACVLAYRKWNHVGELDRPGAWLQRTVANLSLAWRRKHRPRESLPANVGAVPPPELADPELMAALRRLSPAQLGVIVLRYYADQSIDEVARALGKRPGTVRALTSQGLARLRRDLEREEAAHEAR